MARFKHPVLRSLRGIAVAGFVIGAAPPDTDRGHLTKPGQADLPLTDVVPHIGFPTEIGSQRIDPDRHARPTIEVRVAGRGPYRFLVDTGAQATVVGRDLASQLSLPHAGRAMLVATGSRQMVDLVAVDGLAFAERELNLAAIPVLDSQHLGADGILGLDTLQGLRVLIDFAQRRITVADPDVERISGRYEIVVRARKRLGQMIIADATVDGIRTAVVIDTGADISIGNEVLQRRLRAKQQASTTGTDVHGTTFAADMRLANQIVIGTMTIDKVPIGFTQSPAFKALDLTNRPALILGMSTLRSLDRLAIDFASRRVMFDLPRPFASGRTGWSAPRSY